MKTVPSFRTRRPLAAYCIMLLLFAAAVCIPHSVLSQENAVTFALPDRYPLEIGTIWEYREYITEVDCTAGFSIDTLEQYYTRVEAVKTDLLGATEHIRIRYLQTLEYLRNVPQYGDTVESHDWARLQNGDLWFFGYDSRTTGLVTENSKIWKPASSSDDTFTVVPNETWVLDFPLTVGRIWESNFHPVHGILLRTVTGIDTLTVGDSILPCYVVNYGYDDLGLQISTWFSVFGKTRFQSKVQLYNIQGNLIRKYKVSESMLTSFTPVTPVTGISGKRSERNVPSTFTLSQNYPNPFNPSTTIEFSLPRSSRVRLTVYNILGQRVRMLTNASYPAGEYAVRWDGRDDAGLPVSSGIYIYELSAGEFVKRNKMALLR